MPTKTRTIITGTGSYLPPRVIPNAHFLDHTFLREADGKSNQEIIEKFRTIAGMNSRRYALNNQVTSDLATLAAEDLFSKHDILPNDVDCLLVAHNFGDVYGPPGTGTKLDLVPTIASRVKAQVGIRNPQTMAYDLIASKAASDWLHQNHRYTRKSMNHVFIDPEYLDSSLDAVAIAHGMGLHLAVANTYRDPEDLESLVVLHTREDDVAQKVKQNLKLNSNAAAYSVVFGCPGFLEAVRQARSYIEARVINNALIIGAENLPVIGDPNDPDSLLWAAGAGTYFLEGVQSTRKIGFLSHASRTDAITFQLGGKIGDPMQMLRMDRALNPELDGENLFLRMQGHIVSKYASKKVPPVVTESMRQAEVPIGKISKVLLHQANAKMDESILARLFKEHDIRRKDIPPDIMPMIIEWMGNNSVATIPILLDQIKKRKISHEINSGDNVIMASVGAGMNINSTIYREP
jgi:3-oxoacyl-[acyl-carrier-protein] synthase III